MITSSISTYASSLRKSAPMSVAEVAFLAGVGATLPDSLRGRLYREMTTEERNAVVRHFRAADVSPYQFSGVFAQWAATGISCAGSV